MIGDSENYVVGISVLGGEPYATTYTKDTTFKDMLHEMISLGKAQANRPWFCLDGQLQQRLIDKLQTTSTSSIPIITFNLPMYGGGMGPFEFNKMTNPIKKSFSSCAPKWRIISKGLNLEGKCQNQKCQAFKHKVWTQKGVGKFNLNRQVRESVCPLCKTILTSVTNLGFYRAKIFIEGREVGNKQMFRYKSQSDQSDRFVTFQEIGNDLTSWEWLQMTVE